MTLMPGVSDEMVNAVLKSVVLVVTIITWAVLGGFLGFLETPWGSPRFSPASIHCTMIVATCVPNVAFSKLANGS